MRVLLSTLLAFFIGTIAIAATPVGWRWDTSGIFPAEHPPIRWSTTEGIVWKTKLPNYSNGSPVVVGDIVVLAAEPTKLMALRTSDGEIAWQNDNGYDTVLDEEKLAEAKRDETASNELRKKVDAINKQIEKLEEQRKDKPEDAQLKVQRETFDKQIADLREQMKPFDKYRIPEKSAGSTTATPVSDGQFIYSVFGTGIVTCHDLEGNRRWARLLERPETDWGHTASPVLVGSKLLVHLTDLVALDTGTGEILWKAEVTPTYGSPVVSEIGDTDVLVTAHADVVRVNDGAVLADKLVEPATKASLIACDGLVFFSEPKTHALRLPKELSGDELKAEPAWETEIMNENYYASPICRDGLLYSVSENRNLTVLDASDGSKVYEKRLRFKTRGQIVSSLSSAGDYLYVTNIEGTTKVLKLGRDFEEVANNDLEGQQLRSSLVFSGDRLYVRTMEHLWCIENK